MEQCVNFLLKYPWIYNFKVTNLIVDQVLNKIPKPWLDFLQALSLEDFKNVFFERTLSESLPSEVELFIEELSSLYNLVEVDRRKLSISQKALSNEERRGIGTKKEHEVINFANYIEEKCHENGISHVIDIGCGLGYLGEDLVRRGLDVIGVDCNTFHLSRGEARRPITSFPTINLKIGEECLDQLDDIADNSMIVGLHCCGDLTPNLLRMFRRLDKVLGMSLVSCCYHNMTRGADKGFNNFPLSSSLKEILLRRDINDCISSNVFLLRLGAQETKSRWLRMSEENHRIHMKNVGFRALLEKAAINENTTLKKKRRRGIFREIIKDGDENDETIFNNLTMNFEMDDDTRFRLNSNLRDLYRTQKNNFILFELLTGLQYLIQGVIENVIHMDRQQFLKEDNSLKNYELIELFDDKISPRNKVIFAIKGLLSEN